MASWDTNLNKLKKELAILFDKEIDARVVVREAGLDPAHIDFRGKSDTFWNAILGEAQKNGLTSVMAIIDKALEHYPQKPILLDAKRYVYERMQLSDEEDTTGLASMEEALVVDANQPNEQPDSSDVGTKIHPDPLLEEPTNSDDFGAIVAPPNQSADWDSNLNGLRDTLADLYFEKAEYTLFVKDIGIPLNCSVLDGRSVSIWQSILQEVLKAGMIMPVIEKALERAPNSVDLQVAKCYVRNLSQLPSDMSHLSFSNKVLASVCKDLGQLQHTTQFLMCWQRIVIRENEQQPGAPLSFEQCDAIKFSLQDIQLYILRIRQVLLGGHTLLLSVLEQNRLIDKLRTIYDELDDILSNTSYLANCSDQYNMHGIRLRQTIQKQLTKVIQPLDEEQSFLREWQMRFSEMHLHRELSLDLLKKPPLTLVPLDISLPSVMSLSLQNALVLTKSIMREAIITLFDEQECRFICNDLAEQWKKEAIKYDDLPGNTRGVKIDYLLNHWSVRKTLEELRAWLIERDPYFERTLEEIAKKQK